MIFRRDIPPLRKALRSNGLSLEAKAVYAMMLWHIPYEKILEKHDVELYLDGSHPVDVALDELVSTNHISREAVQEWKMNGTIPGHTKFV